MRRYSVLGAAGVFLLATSAWAAGSGRATIPFPFHVGEAELNAGDYDIIVGQPSVSTITIRSCSTLREVFTPAFSFDQQQDPLAREAKLVFTKYGEDEYFLSEVWMTFYGHSMKLVKSQNEIVTSTLVAGLLPQKMIIATRGWKVYH
jgi:hypothetical protein